MVSAVKKKAEMNLAQRNFQNMDKQQSAISLNWRNKSFFIMFKHPLSTLTQFLNFEHSF